MLVADEAVSALDVSVQAQVLELLDEIQTRLGIALLFITHDLRVAAQICDDVAVMQHGRIVEQGPAAQVLTHPQQAYTRQLLDAAPGRGWDFANFRPVAVASSHAAVIPGRCEHRTRNLEDAGLVLRDHPGMTEPRLRRSSQ